jgi:hypothetical protein
MAKGKKAPKFCFKCQNRLVDGERDICDTCAGKECRAIIGRMTIKEVDWIVDLAIRAEICGGRVVKP